MTLWPVRVLWDALGLASGVTEVAWNGASLPFAILTLVNVPYKHGLYCREDSIQYPYCPDTITHEFMVGGHHHSHHHPCLNQGGLPGAHRLPLVPLQLQQQSG